MIAVVQRFTMGRMLISPHEFGVQGSRPCGENSVKGVGGGAAFRVRRESVRKEGSVPYVESRREVCCALLESVEQAAIMEGLE